MDAYEEIVNRSRDYITVINRGYVYEVANDAYCRQIGKSREDVVGETVAQVWGEERFLTAIKPKLDRCFFGEQITYVDRFVFGEVERHINVMFYPYPPSGEVTHALVFSHDITRLSQVEDRLTSYEVRDPTTGLFNRRSMEIILDKEIEQARGANPRPEMRALLFLRLENIGKVVDLYGYQMGDLLIENTGLRILRCVRSSDYVFRSEGTELAVLITEVGEQAGLAGVASKIHQEITVPYQHGGATIAVGARIGVALFPSDGTSRDELTRKAHIAMSDATRRKQPYVFFDAQLHRAIQRRIELGAEITGALQERQFVVFYQPIVNSAGELMGAEALLRWQHPEHGLLLPGSFLPSAIESGVMVSLGRWVLFEVCEQIRQWADHRKLFVTVNMTAGEFLDPEMLDGLRGALDTWSVEPRLLKVEITESEAMENPDAAIEGIRRLQKIGIDVLIDDFGTGHSSLANLRALPARILKLDKSFVSDLGSGPLPSGRRTPASDPPGPTDLLTRSLRSGASGSTQHSEFLRHLVSALKSLQKTVLLEGIETRGEAERAAALGLDLLQGQYFGSAAPAAQISQRIHSS